MLVLTKEQISTLKEEDLDTLCYLDSEGLLLGVSENFSEYKTRLLKIFDNIAHINSEIITKKSVYIDSKTKVNADEQLPENEYVLSNLALTNRYGFRISWISTFFHRNVGMMAGACTLAIESGLSFILISRKFRRRGKWLIYSLQEVITHELCHAARMPIKDNNLEEFFAYSLSASPIRRYLGNCFRNSLDPLLLLLPILILFFVQLYKTYFFSEPNIIFFWSLIFVYPLFLLVRNQMSINIYNRARKYLGRSGFPTQNIQAVLFRCNYDEIKKIASFSGDVARFEEWLSKKINTELRWKVISRRFLSPIGLRP